MKLWLAKKYGLLRWLMSDHTIQTGYLWLPTFQIAMRTGRDKDVLSRIMDSDLVLLKDAVDREVLRRCDAGRKYGIEAGQLQGLDGF